MYRRRGPDALPASRSAHSNVNVSSGGLVVRDLDPTTTEATVRVPFCQLLPWDIVLRVRARAATSCNGSVWSATAAGDYP